MDRLDLLVLGEANVDLLVQAQDPTPVYGQEKLVQDLTLAPGGSASIFACQAARLGLRTALVSVVGEDSFGQFMLDALARRGVDTQYVQRTGETKTGATISLTTAHDRALLTYLGTIATLDSTRIEPRWLAQARHVHVASYFLQPRLGSGLPQLLAVARQSGASISLDTGWDPEGHWDRALQACLMETDLFLPNESEALAITGELSLKEALAKLAARIPVVAIKLGSQGAIAQHGDHVVRAAALSVEVVDTTGAGDSFDAGFVYAYLQGWSLRACLEFGIICGGLSTRAVGGTASQPTLDEVEHIRSGLVASARW